MGAAIVIGFVLIIFIPGGAWAQNKKNEKNKANGNGNGNDNFDRYILAMLSNNVHTHVLQPRLAVFKIWPFPIQVNWGTAATKRCGDVYFSAVNTIWMTVTPEKSLGSSISTAA